MIVQLKSIYSDFFKIKFTNQYTYSFDVYEKKKELKIFKNNFFRNSYFINSNKKNIYFITSTGNLFFLQKEKINNNQFHLKKINSNIKKLISQKYINKKKGIIKDILVDDKNIYISYVSEKAECYSNAILKGEIRKYIEFHQIYKINECKKRFNYAAGGNIELFDKKNLLLTVGDYASYEDATVKVKNDPQNPESLYGKILLINLVTKKEKILSMGHRNQQGLYFFENQIYSTEHGPQGGDEINIINPYSNRIQNFGWGISSYGEHYGYPKNASELFDKKNKKPEIYINSPLYKSHSKHGFIEPLIYFTPSIAITEILVKKFNQKENLLIFGAMGNKVEEGDKSLHFLKIDENNNIINLDKIVINERIRDISYYDKTTSRNVVLSLESSGSIGFLKNKN